MVEGSSTAACAADRTDERWVSLFSGGKDSSYALYRALDRGLPVHALLTVSPPEHSSMYHVPALDVTKYAARSIGLPLHRVAADVTPDDATISEQGDAELAPLERALADLVADEGVTGVIAGAIESEFQASRIEAMCDRLGLDLFAPLWQQSPETLAQAMLDAGFEITIVQVAAAGLDASWLGRSLDHAALAELQTLATEYGVHILGEGGEFETIVTDGPHMERPIELQYTTEWEGTRGQITITDIALGTSD